MASIKIEKVEKYFKENHVLKDINLDVKDGELIVFVGPSGCGKSTLLRIIAGLEDVSSGKVFIDERDVTAQPANVRKLSMVFQSYALYPHMSVEKNLGFALKSANFPKKEISRRVNRSASVLKLDNLLSRYPKELSGGQRQRVAIGRAIVREPLGFLFDEPLSNLDASLRGEMRYEIAKLHLALKSTMIYVTHDQIEAMTLADKIIILNQGSIIQIGKPHEIYEKPRNLFVAKFIGSPNMNVFAWDSKLVAFKKNSPVSKKIKQLLQERENLLIGIRAEHIKLVKPKKGNLDGVVEVVEYLGADSYIYVQVSKVGNFIVRESEMKDIKPGQVVGLKLDESKLYFFDPKSELSLN